MAPYEIWPLQPRAFIGDTRNLPAGAVGAYARLLMHFWVNRKLPADDHALGRIAGLQGKAWRNVREQLRPLFYDTDAPTGWKHRRTERDLAHAARYHQQKRAAANARWHPVNPDESPVDNLGNSADLSDPPRGWFAEEVKPLENNGAEHAAAMRTQCPIESIDRIPSIAARESSDVDKTRHQVQTGDVPFSPERNRSYQRAHQRMLRALLSSLGETAYAEAISILSADSALLHKATLTEQRKPGRGAAVALAGLRQHIARVP